MLCACAQTAAKKAEGAELKSPKAVAKAPTVNTTGLPTPAAAVKSTPTPASRRSAANDDDDDEDVEDSDGTL